MEKDKNSHCCVFCYRIFKQEESAMISSRNKTQEQFFLLLKRHLSNINGAVTRINLLSSESVRNVISPCADCSGVLRSFCEHYEEMKVLEMKLEWTLRTLKNIVESSEKVKFRQTLFLEKLRGMTMTGLDLGVGADAKDVMRNVKKFRKQLVKNHKRIFQTTYPKLELRRCDVYMDLAQQKTIRAPKRPHEDNLEQTAVKIPRLSSPPQEKVTNSDGRRDTDALSLFNEILNESSEPLVEEENQNDLHNEKELDSVAEAGADVQGSTMTNANIANDDDKGRARATSNDINDNITIAQDEVLASLNDSPVPSPLYVLSSEVDFDLDDSSRPRNQTNANSVDLKPSIRALTIAEEEESASSIMEPTVAPPAGAAFACHPKDTLIQTKKEKNASPVKRKTKTSTSTGIAKGTMVSESESEGLSTNNNEIELGPVMNATEIKKELKNSPSPKKSKVCGGRRVSLRRRYQCTKCSKYMSSSEKLQEHLKTCPNDNEQSKMETERESEEKNADAECDDNDADDFNPEMDLDDVVSGAGSKEEEEEDMSEEDVVTKDDRKRSKKAKKRQSTTKVKTESKSEFHCKEFNCGESFKSKYALYRHEEVKHHPDKYEEITCEFPGCNKKFKRKCFLTIHVKQVHQPRNYSCTFCKKSEFTRDELIYHQNQVHGKIKPEITSSKDYFPSHEDGEDEEVFQCPVSSCPEKSQNVENLQAHSLLHGHFKCQFCEVTKSYAPDLAIHEALSHEREKPRSQPYSRKSKCTTYSCSRCDFPEYKESIYVQHFLRVHLNLTFTVGQVCCICKTTFDNKKRFQNNIVEHYDSHHDYDLGEGEDTAHRCDHDDCSAYFLKEEQLMTHKFHFHNEKRRFPCPVPDCKKSFASKFELREHGGKMHKSVFHLKCPEKGCLHRFQDDDSLKKHISMWHSKSTAFICPECGKSFKAERLLAIHNQTVHGPNRKPKLPVSKKTYVCSECGKEFRDKGALELHVLGVHRDPKEWMFSCDHCGKKCLTKRKLQDHQRTHTQDKPFKCDKCGSSFAHRHNFRHHLKNKHGIINMMEDARRRKPEPNV